MPLRGADLSESCTCGFFFRLTVQQVSMQIIYTQRIFSQNLVKSNRNQIVFTIFRLIWNQTDSVRLVPNKSENSKYNLISV